MKSTARLSDWRGDLTTFSGYFSARPADEFRGVTWALACHHMAPAEGPTLPLEKERGVYFVPCALASSPLIGKTRERAIERGLSLEGQQRSAAHVTSARMIVVDLDGIDTNRLTQTEGKLRGFDLTYLLYSTYSHGRTDKPGYRVRVVVPSDTALCGTEYTQAATGLNIALFDGLADPSGFKLHQQQGVWATSEDRKHLAFRKKHLAGVASAVALIAAAPVTERRTSVVGPVNESAGPLHADTARINGALAWLNPDDYSSWINAGLWLRAAYGDGAFPIWQEWGESASDEAKVANQGKYEPVKVWSGLAPYISPEAGAGALFGAAKDAVMGQIKSASSAGTWGPKAKDGLVYLRRYHPRLYNETFGVAS